MGQGPVHVPTDLLRKDLSTPPWMERPLSLPYPDLASFETRREAGKLASWQAGRLAGWAGWWAGRLVDRRLAQIPSSDPSLPSSLRTTHPIPGARDVVDDRFQILILMSLCTCVTRTLRLAQRLWLVGSRI